MKKPHTISTRSSILIYTVLLLVIGLTVWGYIARDNTILYALILCLFGIIICQFVDAHRYDSIKDDYDE